MNGRKRKKIKPLKKTKRAAKRPRVISINKLSKRRNKDIFDINLKGGHKSIDDVNKVISKQKFNRIGELPDEFVKLTFFAKKGKQKASINLLYSVDPDNPQDLKEAVSDAWKEITRKVEKRTTKSIKRMNHLKNYLSKIIIDFQSAT